MTTLSLARREFFTAAVLCVFMRATPARSAPTGVSTRMLDLAADFKRHTEALQSIDFYTQGMAWDAAANARCRALEALLDERPANLAEFLIKFSALIEYTEEDSELV